MRARTYVGAPVVPGICHCFANYGSSDSSGGAGGRGDCGYIEPFAPRKRHEERPKTYYHGVIYDIPLEEGQRHGGDGGDRRGGRDDRGGRDVGRRTRGWGRERE
jgi:hypothetical protein